MLLPQASASKLPLAVDPTESGRAEDSLEPPHRTAFTKQGLRQHGRALFPDKPSCTSTFHHEIAGQSPSNAVLAELVSGEPRARVLALSRGSLATHRLGPQHTQAQGWAPHAAWTCSPGAAQSPGPGPPHDAAAFPSPRTTAVPSCSADQRLLPQLSHRHTW